MITNETLSDMFEKLSVTGKQIVSVQGPQKTEYNCETFWNKIIVKEPVIMHNTHAIAAATKNLIAGIFNKEDNTYITDLALKLSFYVVDGDDAHFVYEKILTFENMNLSEKIFGATIRRRVKLVCNGWFEKWCKHPNSLNETVGDLQYYLQTPSNNVCISYWGPWLATIILSLESETVANVARNIDALFSKLFRLYRGLNFDFPEINIKFWEENLNSVHVTNLDEPKKNCLFWSMITVFHDEETPKTIIDLLNLTMIPSLRFKNMELITLIDEFKKRVGFEPRGALLSSLSASTLLSWENYIKMTETYLDPKHPLGKDPLWPYSREFDSTVFMAMSYEENFKLCNMLAMIIDLSESVSYSYEGDNIGPTYKKLISGKIIKKLSPTDFKNCKKVHQFLEQKANEISANIGPQIKNALNLY